MIDERSAQLWLFRPKPLNDELLSSWLVRCAYANVRKLHSFCTSTWGARHHFWERDLDRSADLRLLTVLADSTNTARNRTYSTTLAAYEGMLFERFVSSGELPWVMSIGKKGRKRFGYGMQFCPRCLNTDKYPYYRRSWRLSCFVVCPVHGCYLHDSCPFCGAPVTFHQSDYREKILPHSTMATECNKCRLDRRSIQPVQCGGDERKNRLMTLQASIADTIRTGWALQPGGPENHIMALPYFSGLHDLVRALCSRSRTGRLREGCIIEMGIEDVDTELSITGAFDSFRLKERTYVLEMVAWLIDRWPDRLVEISLEADLASSYFLSYKDSTAYWFYSTINEHLNRLHYHPSKQEIESCKSFLNFRGLLVSMNNVQRWLGRYYVDKSRYVKP